MQFELKPLSVAAIPAALEKAHRYRLLNEPWQAESILRRCPANRAAKPDSAGNAFARNHRSVRSAYRTGARAPGAVRHGWRR